jgi:hypothetical protein
VPAVSGKGYCGRRRVGRLSYTRSCRSKGFCEYEHLVILYLFADLVDFLGLATPKRFYILVLVHTPLFTFVRPLVLLIFTNLTCFVCFVLIRSLHHKLTKGANGHEES